MRDLIDLDDQGTWPSRLLAVADGQHFNPETEDWRELLEDRPLRTYHATRLLPHEVECVRSTGLCALTPTLMETRIDEALRLGHIDHVQAMMMRSSNTFARHRSAGRTGVVCSIVGRAILRDRLAVQGLLCCWGGEALHGHDRGIQRLVSRIGTPTLVVLNQTMPANVKTNLFPDLVTTFRNTYRKTECGSTDVMHYESIPATSVVEVLDAEHASESGRFPELGWLREGPQF